MISSKWLFHAIFITQTMAVVRMWREPWGCLDGRGITEEHSAVLFFCPVSVLLSFSLITSNTPDHDVFIFFPSPSLWAWESGLYCFFVFVKASPCGSDCRLRSRVGKHDQGGQLWRLQWGRLFLQTRARTLQVPACFWKK